ncbi:hypothetical protein D046_0364, partial [Vibrio parahaemolyticus V-223/04]
NPRIGLIVPHPLQEGQCQ